MGASVAVFNASQVVDPADVHAHLIKYSESVCNCSTYYETAVAACKADPNTDINTMHQITAVEKTLDTGCKLIKFIGNSFGSSMRYGPWVGASIAAASCCACLCCLAIIGAIVYCLCGGKKKKRDVDGDFDDQEELMDYDDDYDDDYA